MIIHIEASTIIVEKNDGTKVTLEIEESGVSFAVKSVKLVADVEKNLTMTIPFELPEVV